MDSEAAPKKRRDPRLVYADMFRPYVGIQMPAQSKWITPGCDLSTIPGPMTVRPSQPWRWLASACRWLAFRLLLGARRAEIVGLREPEITERSLGEAMDEFKARAEGFALKAEQGAA